MSKGTHPLKLPASVKAAAARLAREDGVSLNQWIASAVAQKVRAVETAADLIQRWGSRGTPAGLLHFLDNAPQVPPAPEDELEEGVAERAA
jgi:hypothetical protein